MRLVAITLVVSVFVTVPVQSCGVGVHLSIARRNQELWPEDIKPYDRYIRAGAFFPDAFYSCAGHSEAAEAAHWPPFLKAAVEHYHKKEQLHRTNVAEFAEQRTHTTKQNTIQSTSFTRRWQQKLFGLWSQQDHPRDQDQDQDQTLDLDDIHEQQAREHMLDRRKDGLLALKAFIYSMLTHQVADVSWHSLGVAEGLLQIMSKREFGGDTDSAHSTLDIGGDMIHVSRMLSSGHDLSWYRGSWDYPAQDIVEIFAAVGFKVSKSQLDYCMLRGNAAMLAEFQIASGAFEGYAKRSPLLFDELESYYMGGLAEIVQSTQHCTRNLNSWFDDYSDEWSNKTVDWEICEMFEGMRRRRSNVASTSDHQPEHHHHEHQHHFKQNVLDSVNKLKTSLKTTTGTTNKVKRAFTDKLSAATAFISGVITSTTAQQLTAEILSHPDAGNVSAAQSGFGTNIIVGNFCRNGTRCLAVSAPYEGLTGAIYLHHTDDTSTLEQRISESDLPVTNQQGSGQTYWPRFGAAMCKLRLGDSRDILVASSPGTSSVHFYYDGNPEPILSVTWANGATIDYGKIGPKLIGESIAAGDLSGDGFEDLVVGSPYSDDLENGFIQAGKVYVLDGQTLWNALDTAIYTASTSSRSQQKQHRVFDIAEIKHSVVDVPSSEPQKDYTLFGTRLAISSQHNVLIVGAGGIGKVWGFDAQFNKVFVASGSETSSSFGRDFIAVNNNIVAIGSSTNDIFSETTGRVKCTQCGEVYIYALSNDTGVRTQLELVGRVHDEQTKRDSFTRYGRMGIVDDNMVLYVASPYSDSNKGAVWTIDLKRMSKGNPIEQKLVVSEGPSPYNSGFGLELAIDNEREHLYAGMPRYAPQTIDSESGAVARYSIKAV